MVLSCVCMRRDGGQGWEACCSNMMMHAMSTLLFLLLLLLLLLRSYCSCSCAPVRPRSGNSGHVHGS